MRVASILIVLLAACGDDGGGSGECDEGETRACYQGPNDTRGVGACIDGIELCASGRWPGICVGDITPFVEKCNFADDDCNGVVDDAEGFGDACTSADGCGSTKACSNGAMSCLTPGKNECGLCDGPTVDSLGAACSNTVCSGVLACSTDGTSAVCNAPGQNACEVCGGPVINGLGDDCTAASGCLGSNVCNATGSNTTCSCNPVPGMCKAGGNLRAVDSPAPGDLVITEVMASPGGVDTDEEWFEVLVMRDVDLNQVALDRVGDSLAPNVIQSRDCIRVTAGSRLVFARKTDPLVNNGLPAVTATFSFTLAAPGDVRVLLDATLLDAITWLTATNATSRQLDPDLETIGANDDPNSFCDGTTPYGTRTSPAQDLGTPGAANTQCPLIVPAGSCLDGGTPRSIVKPAANALVITEFLSNPAGTSDSTREWIEIANTSGAAFDLNDLTVARVGTAGTKITAQNCISIGGGQLGLLARSNDGGANGGLVGVDATFGFSIVDSNGDIEVRDGAATLDAIVYTTGVGTSGVARQVDPDNATSALNDNPSNTTWCPATATYGDGTNTGTPKLANAQCP